MNGRILIISHELSRTGAPIMVLQAARSLKKNNYYVSVLSHSDGPLADTLIQDGISVLLGGPIYDDSKILLDYCKAFDLVIINTIVCIGAVHALANQDIPVFWWIHEGTTFIPEINEYLPKELPKNLHIYCVSNYTRQLIINKHSYDVKVLYNGVEEFHFDDMNTMETNLRRFICIGSIEPRKGQDILLEAINILISKGLYDLEFIFVGNVLSQNIKDEITKYGVQYPNIKYYPVMSRNEVLRLMISSAAIIVPSRDDPSPLVASEAMMLCKPVVVSNKTGTAELINDGENGFIFDIDNVNELAEKIQFISTNNEEAKRIGRSGRGLYEKYYSETNFTSSFINCVNELLNGNRRIINNSEQTIPFDYYNDLFSDAILVQQDLKCSIEKINERLTELEAEKDYLERINHELETKKDHLEHINHELEVEKDTLVHINHELEVEKDSLVRINHELDECRVALTKSFSFRLGHALLFFPRIFIIFIKRFSNQHSEEKGNTK